MQHVILVHGCPGNAASWDPLTGHLSASAEVTALNLRDVGRDEPDVSLDDLLADVVARVVASPSPVTLVGHSFGAWVAGHVAARLPGRVARLVLLAGMREVAPPMSDGLLGLAGAIEAGQLPLDALVAAGAERWLDPEGPDAGCAGMVRALFEAEPAARIARALRRGATAGTPIPAAGVAARVLCCEGDRAVPADLGRALAAHLRAELTVLPGASHFVHWRDPAEVARRILP